MENSTGKNIIIKNDSEANCNAHKSYRSLDDHMQKVL